MGGTAHRLLFENDGRIGKWKGDMAFEDTQLLATKLQLPAHTDILNVLHWYHLYTTI
jgi:hypothetical protein